MKCGHVRLRWWSSQIHNRTRIVADPKNPMVFVTRDPHGWWCPSCDRYWGWPREGDPPDPEQPEELFDVMPRTPPPGSWAIYALPDHTLTVAAGGHLTEVAAREFADALHQARRAVNQARERRVPDAWGIDRASGDLVLSRSGRTVACLLVPVCPRRLAACLLCSCEIAVGVRCYRGERMPQRRAGPLERWRGAREVQDLARLRVCAACVVRLAGEPAESWPVRHLDREPATRDWPMARGEA